MVSAALAIINIVVYILCVFQGETIYARGELDAYHVLAQGQYDRILFSMFLHANVNHLASNMMILFFLGSMIEQEIGHIRCGLLYLGSGICGGFLSLLEKVVTHSRAASVGASGAVFGLDSVLLAMVLFWDRRLPNVTFPRVMLMILLSLYSGFSGGNVDNAAHVGGLLSGFVGGCIVCLIQRRKSRKNNL